MINNWEQEKKADLLKAFTRVMQGEPADGGNSAEETLEYLKEFKAELLQSIVEEIEEMKKTPVKDIVYCSSYEIALDSLKAKLLEGKNK